jgi:peptide/nickel transport system substrate-binding protein
MRKKMFTLLSLVILASMLLAACAPAAPTPETIIKTVVVTEQVEVAGTPQIVEKVVTATPEPVATEVLKSVSPEFKNPDTFMVIDGAGEQESLDPAWTYETRGGAIEGNLYEGLVFFNREKTDEFIPALATEWSLSDDSLTWTFKIRQGVTFHEGGTLEPHDVAYSTQRTLLQGRADGAQWMAWGALFGSDFEVASAKDFAAALKGKETFEELSPADLADVCEQVKTKVVADDAAGTVTFTVAQPTPWFLAMLTQPFVVYVLDQEWMVEQGDWDGDCATWQNFADPAAENTILFDKANGTGPYKLDHWTPGEETVLVANDNYWRTEPMWEGGPSGPPQIKRVVFKNVTEWGTRLSMLEAGDADWIYTPAQYRGQLYPYAKNTCDGATGECKETNPNGYLTVWRDEPMVAMTPAQFNWNINVEGGNPFAGSGTLDGLGIPSDFFSDLHVRKAFNYCFDFNALLTDALAGEGVQAQGPIIKGMMGYRDEPPMYSYDPAKCEEEFKLADLNHNGKPAGEDPEDVWDMGFYMQIAYNQGNDTRRLAGEIIKAGIEGVNDKFSVQVLAMPWPVLLATRRQGKLPIYIGGWAEDFHDPHNWVQPFLSSQGAYGRVINMTDEYKKKYDDLISQGVKEQDPEKRKAIYEQIQLAAEEDAVVIWMYQQNWMDPFQLSIQGYYYNPAYSESRYTWIYALSKVAP